MSSVITADVSEPLYLNSFCIGYRLTDPQTLDQSLQNASSGPPT